MAIQPSRNGTVTKAHVNLMTDTIIANLQPDALRSVIRSILTADPSFTSIFEEHTRNHLQKSSSIYLGALFEHDGTMGWRATPSFAIAQHRIRAMIGSGLSFDSLDQIRHIVDQAKSVRLIKGSSGQVELETLITSVDGDIVQALTAVQKTLNQPSGQRDFTQGEYKKLDALFQTLNTCREEWRFREQEFLFERSLGVVAGVLAKEVEIASDEFPQTALTNGDSAGVSTTIEKFQIGSQTLPRLFSGLWQLSSPSWGVAPKSRIFSQFWRFVGQGFTAYDMADHYGDAEILFGKFRSTYSYPDTIFGSTKYCVFQPITITPKVVHDNVSERCRRLASDHVDLLQFHWQFYEDKQYIQALRLLQSDNRVRLLGLCNFDTLRLKEVLASGVKIVTNQVQFSLIDSRPTIKMGKVCQEHGIKLLTYGTLCGGFLAEKWLGQPEPELFSDSITPSQRKYFEMILAWGGWTLFQELLQSLKTIATKHNVAVSNVATRWVLDFDYVGAVIVGARMGVSEHGEENLASYGWRLGDEDQEQLNAVLARSRRTEIFEVMGDCGGEYR
ncbi:uncharacterized protein A1O9_01577 [Exophiala aquamarina CBS 119918]|uniref:NADP-dependent oxidoreductase domain-containing protein n=1 Tax=Exophiala aquamarina CBS 119918 TaxID=1182545 RepID=A0A072PU09_9EURO|nr:uncharacterized protein A1O9_01577 [Exophiala aquamarina CBS 119918]KEF63599.1 hypothetical protein A1O9_01577 [Exophiala aquamarina CBS 119918]